MLDIHWVSLFCSQSQQDNALFVFSLKPRIRPVSAHVDCALEIQQM